MASIACKVHSSTTSARRRRLGGLAVTHCRSRLRLFSHAAQAAHWSCRVCCVRPRSLQRRITPRPRSAGRLPAVAPTFPLYFTLTRLNPPPSSLRPDVGFTTSRSILLFPPLLHSPMLLVPYSLALSCLLSIVELQAVAVPHPTFPQSIPLVRRARGQQNATEWLARQKSRLEGKYGVSQVTRSKRASGLNL